MLTLQIISLCPASELTRPSHLNTVWAQILLNQQPEVNVVVNTKHETVLYVVSRKK